MNEDALKERIKTIANQKGSTPKTGAVELLLACIGLYSDSKIIKISQDLLFVSQDDSFRQK